jgi:hypothetical protein
MDYRTPNDVALDVDSDEGRLIPNLDEQLPLEVCSSTEGCFIYDAHGAEVGYTYKQDWENDPKGYIVWMAEELRKVYETPVEALKQAAQYEPMFLFYDSVYPTDDVSCKQTNEATLGKGRELPPLNGREPTDPKKSPFTIVTEDHYTEEQPSAIRISDGETISEEWFVEHTEDAAKNTELGAEIAWNIRLAYERPWELRD